MISKLKYVIFQGDGLPFPVILSPKSSAQHCDIVIEEAEPISAGFVDLTGPEPHCWGESFSLRLKSRPKLDEKVFKINLYGKEPI